MRRVTVLAVCLLHIACTEQRAVTPEKQAPVASAPPSANVLACDWPGFARTTSLERLNEHFGAANIKTADEGEGFTTVTVYPGQPTKMVQLRIFNNAEFNGASVDSSSTTWTLPGGAGMGASLEEVQRANGRPFEILVFAGGANSPDWQGGALASGGCHYFANFEHGDQKIAQPYKVRSDDPATRALGLKVGRFGLDCSSC